MVDILHRKIRMIIICLSLLVFATLIFPYIKIVFASTRSEVSLSGFNLLAGKRIDISGASYKLQTSQFLVVTLVLVALGLLAALFMKRLGDMAAVVIVCSLASMVCLYISRNELSQFVRMGASVRFQYGSLVGFVILFAAFLICFYTLMKKSARVTGTPWFWLFIGPCVVALIVVVFVPTVIGLFYAFTNWDGINEMKFIGLANFDKLRTDTMFWDRFVFTAKFAVASVIFINGVGLALAMLVTRRFKGRNILRTVFYVPNLIGGLILGYIWNFIFVDIFGSIGQALHIPFFQGWLSNTTTGFWGLIIVTVWQMAGYMMVIYVAYLENVPEDLLEAARIDGAQPRQVFYHIILPMIAPAFTINTFLTLSNSFKLFDQNLALTGGSPGNTTQLLALNIYATAFSANRLAYAQAKALVFFVIVGLISLVQVYYSKRMEVEV